MRRSSLRLVLFFLASTAAASPARAAEWFVHHEQGRDTAAGTAAAPLATAQKAVDRAQPGDVIHLLPDGAVYRQSISFRGKTDVTLEGHGVTLDGSDPLPVEGWEIVAGDLRRRKLPRTPLNRYLLSFDGRTERMDRSTSSGPDSFPAPEKLTDGQFAVVPIDDQSIWLYVRGPIAGLEWSTRVNGVGFGGENRGIVVHHINARRFLNDGFNIHGNSLETRFSEIDGYDCFDEGFSAHDTCTCEIEEGRFWGNENAIADVNDSITHYRNCEFRSSRAVDVLLSGRKHNLVDCSIRNAPRTMALTGSTRSDPAKTFEVRLERVDVTSTDRSARPRIRFDGGTVRIIECRLDQTELTERGTKIEAIDSSLPPHMKAKQRPK